MSVITRRLSAAGGTACPETAIAASAPLASQGAQKEEEEEEEERILPLVPCESHQLLAGLLSRNDDCSGKVPPINNFFFSFFFLVVEVVGHRSTRPGLVLQNRSACRLSEGQKAFDICGRTRTQRSWLVRDCFIKKKKKKIPLILLVSSTFFETDIFF